MKFASFSSIALVGVLAIHGSAAYSAPQNPANPGKKPPAAAAVDGENAVKKAGAAVAGAAQSLPTTAEERQKRIESALKFLGTQQKEGRFGSGVASDPGVTAIALSSVIKTTAKFKLDRPAWVGQGLDYLASLQKPDGSIYQQGLQNYITSVSIEALVASGDAKYAKVIEKALAYVKQGQFDEAEGFSAEKDNEYGGFGYGSAEHPETDPKDHPDLSNTQLALQALHDAKVDKNDPAWSKAVTFLQHCQNSTETGAKPFTQPDGKVIVPGNDGGAMYRPGSSKAGIDPIGDNKFTGRSYGSMTYSLLKCYLFAGVDPKDPRVAAAIDWIHKHYTLETNPGFDAATKNAQYQGLYYYYLSLARALSGLGQEVIKDGDGVEHKWRTELETKLYELQAEDGHWVNDRSPRWMENNVVLATGYALLALGELR